MRLVKGVTTSLCPSVIELCSEGKHVWKFISQTLVLGKRRFPNQIPQTLAERLRKARTHAITYTDDWSKQSILWHIANHQTKYVCACALFSHLWAGCHLLTVERLVCSNEPQCYAIWNLVLLVWSPMVNRSVVWIQTKHGPNSGCEFRELYNGAIPSTSTLFNCRSLPASIPLCI